jgi:hypothetical protein
VAFGDSFVASVGHVPLLLLAAIVVISAGHDSPMCSMRHRHVCRLERSDRSSSVLRPLVGNQGRIELTLIDGRRSPFRSVLNDCAPDWCSDRGKPMISGEEWCTDYRE